MANKYDEDDLDSETEEEEEVVPKGKKVKKVKEVEESASTQTGRGFWSRAAAFTFFTLVALQFPFFEQPNQGPKDAKYTVRVSPIQVVVSQLMITNTIPEDYLRAALFPGATARQVQKTAACVLGMKSKGCRKKIRWIPQWKNLIKNNDPSKVDAMMSQEFKDRKVQLVAGSFMCMMGGVYVLFTNTRLPVFGVVLYLYPLLRKGFSVLPTSYFWLACLCSLITIYIGDLGKKKPAAKPKEIPKTKSAEEAERQMEYLKNLEANARREKAAREKMKNKDA